MEITSTSHHPFERLAIDIVSPLPQTINNNRFILTMQDDLSKYSYAACIPNHESQNHSIKTCKILLCFRRPYKHFIRSRYRLPQKLIKDLTKLHNTKHVFSSNGALMSL